MTTNEKKIEDKLHKAYVKGGANAVYDLAKKYKLQESECKQCDAQTPTINNSCAICGATK